MSAHEDPHTSHSDLRDEIHRLRFQQRERRIMLAVVAAFLSLLLLSVARAAWNRERRPPERVVERVVERVRNPPCVSHVRSLNYCGSDPCFCAGGQIVVDNNHNVYVCTCASTPR